LRRKGKLSEDSNKKGVKYRERRTKKENAMFGQKSEIAPSPIILNCRVQASLTAEKERQGIRNQDSIRGSF